MAKYRQVVPTGAPEADGEVRSCGSIAAAAGPSVATITAERAVTVEGPPSPSTAMPSSPTRTVPVTFAFTRTLPDGSVARSCAATASIPRAGRQFSSSKTPPNGANATSNCAAVK